MQRPRSRLTGVWLSPDGLARTGPLHPHWAGGSWGLQVLRPSLSWQRWRAFQQEGCLHANNRRQASSHRAEAGFAFVGASLLAMRDQQA